jgi:hypothetical protein
VGIRNVLDDALEGAPKLHCFLGSEATGSLAIEAAESIVDYGAESAIALEDRASAYGLRVKELEPAT